MSEVPPREASRYGFYVEKDSEAERYLLACARIRKIKPQTLVHRLFKLITADQLIESILDDGPTTPPRSRLPRPYVGEHR